MTATLDFTRLSDDERIELDRLMGGLVWMPHPENKPQIDAYFTPAFETLYGGAAGGGKSDLLLGLARTMHRRSLLLRRTFPDLERSLISRSLEFYGDRRGYNAAKHMWGIDGRRVEFGHMERIGTAQVPGDEAQYASAPYDLIGFDQLEQFTRYAYEFMFSRVRSADGRRTRVVSSVNWVGDIYWILQRWRAWLIDMTAKPGEILWFKRDDDGNDIQTTADDPDALSRTFIPARLEDNPYLGDDYRRTLESLPEPLRSALRSGNVGAMLTDDAYQVIPRAWVRSAMERWTSTPPESEASKPVVIGDDMARGGDDKMVLAPRRGDWYGELIKYPGRQITTGAKATKPLIEYLVSNGLAEKTDKEDIEYKDDGFSLPILKSDTVVNIDVIGIGASAYDTARTHGINAHGINFGEGSNATDTTGKIHFLNKRAECYWSFREALDPNGEHRIALPPDPELEADLCAPHWAAQSKGIKIESKEELKKRLGRSPDTADAVVLAWAMDKNWWMS